MNPITTLSFQNSITQLPPADDSFFPIQKFFQEYEVKVAEIKDSIPLWLALEREAGLISVSKLRIIPLERGFEKETKHYVERMLKIMLWIIGGFKLFIAGPNHIVDFISEQYRIGGRREFDVRIMSKVYEKEFEVIKTSFDRFPETKESVKTFGGNLNGCRIGFDAGGSDLKVAAVIDGEVVYSEEVVWHPKIMEDPDYHYSEILKAFQIAAAKMPRVDAIGVSSAGIYVNNRTMTASLFMKVPEDLYEQKVKDIYIRAAKTIGHIPLEVANDGDVAALAGGMELNDGCVLGIAMGTSQAAGYVDENRNITGWLNELAFVPVDISPKAMEDEWSGDIGCGVKYFSQDAVIKLAGNMGYSFERNLTPAEKLKMIQKLLIEGDKGVAEIYQSIGVYLANALSLYSRFYHIKHVLLLGRVMSGEGGNIILRWAKDTLAKEYPELSKTIRLSLPNEANRRVGQAIAAASLPKLS